MVSTVTAEKNEIINLLHAIKMYSDHMVGVLLLQVHKFDLKTYCDEIVLKTHKWAVYHFH